VASFARIRENHNCPGLEGLKELANHYQEVEQLKRKRPVDTLTVGDLFVAQIPPLERLKVNANFTPRIRETAR
jgi:FMN-dependent NADH-azoreductase